MPPSGDPRVLFAAERTLLAWNRTSLSFMGFGFLIERFDMLLLNPAVQQDIILQRNLPFWIGTAFITMGITFSISSMLQYRRIFRTLRGAQALDDFSLNSGLLANGIIALLGLALLVYLFSR